MAKRIAVRPAPPPPANPFNDSASTIIDLNLSSRFDPTDDRTPVDSEATDRACRLRSMMAAEIVSEGPGEVFPSGKCGYIDRFVVSNGALFAVGTNDDVHLVTDNATDLRTLISHLEAAAPSLRPISAHPQWQTIVTHAKDNYGGDEGDDALIDTGAQCAQAEDLRL